jgi:HD superfamily phosphodiesterase
MKKLNLANAKQIALDMSLKINPIDRREFLLVHSEKVGIIAKIIAQKLHINNEILEIAGWVHDVGYIKNVENHADFAIPVLQELGYETDDILEDCILNHGNGKNPRTIEGKIFQLSDKLSIFDYDTIEIFLKHGDFPLKLDDINFLKMMSEKAIELLNNFEK